MSASSHRRTSRGQTERAGRTETEKHLGWEANPRDGNCQVVPRLWARRMASVPEGIVTPNRLSLVAFPPLATTTRGAKKNLLCSMKGEAEKEQNMIIQDSCEGFHLRPCLRHGMCG